MLALLLERATLTFAAGALLSETLQVDELPALNVVGLQVMLDTWLWPETVSAKVNICELPLRDAMICAEPFEVNEPATALKLAVEEPAIAVMEAGTETLALLELRAIAAPEAGAGLLSVTRQLDVPPGFTDAGVQIRVETWARLVSASEADAAPPFSEAVICAEPSAVNEPAAAVKLALVAPAVALIEAGTKTFTLLELRAITTPEVGAGLLSVARQLDIPPGFNDAGVQLKAETWERVVNASEADAPPPLSEAVICAEPSVVNEAAVAVKFALVAPAITVMEPGTETLTLLELRAIVAPEAGAALLRVTRQPVVPPGFNNAGVQLTLETWERVVNASEADAELPLSEAVICAVPSEVNEPAVAAKLALVAPAITAIEAGTETLALLEFTGIARAVGAGLFSVSAQADVPLGLNEAGLQVKPVTYTGWIRLIVPGVTETGIPFPAESDTTGCVI